jgi:hypothetical protein
MTSRKKPGLAFWATVVVVVVLVAYPLSFGPACWITSRFQPSGEDVSATRELLAPALRRAEERRNILARDASPWKTAQRAASPGRGDTGQRRIASLRGPSDRGANHFFGGTNSKICKTLLDAPA